MQHRRQKGGDSGETAARCLWIAAAAIALSMGRAYRNRIDTEEAMLAATFAEDYAQYAGRTRRLIPFVF